MRLYRILNFLIEISYEDGIEELELLKEFAVDAPGKVSECDIEEDLVPDMKLHICEKNLREICYGISYVKPELLSGIHRMFLSQFDQKTVLYAGDPKYQLQYLEKREDCTEEYLTELLMAGFYSHVSQRETLLLHASAVKFNGKAVIFSAPSGTGKTTQAELWQLYEKAQILNGDKVFLKQEADGLRAWGSPWKGSSPYVMNESAPAAGVLILRQAEENRIRTLDTMEAMELFFPHVFFPCWDEECEAAAVKFLDRVMSELPVYLLECRPDQEAVELVKKELFSE